MFSSDDIELRIYSAKNVNEARELLERNNNFALQAYLWVPTPYSLHLSILSITVIYTGSLVVLEVAQQLFFHLVACGVFYLLKKFRLNFHGITMNLNLLYPVAEFQYWTCNKIL
jgi:hypothetical protein